MRKYGLWQLLAYLLFLLVICLFLFHFVSLSFCRAFFSLSPAPSPSLPPSPLSLSYSLTLSFCLSSVTPPHIPSLSFSFLSSLLSHAHSISLIPLPSPPLFLYLSAPPSHFCLCLPPSTPPPPTALSPFLHTSLPLFSLIRARTHTFKYTPSLFPFLFTNTQSVSV